jgi:putative transposase
VFELFDPAAEVRVTAGSLPHWYQPGVTYFITFRTDDSMPQEVADRWYRERDDWLRRHGIDPGSATWKTRLGTLPDVAQREFNTTFSREWMAYLNQGRGECVLKRPELARVVTDNLLHFDQQRYHLADFVVMPNHVHLLVCLVGSTELEAQCYSWKKYTAGRINKLLGRSGRFWHEESFDHLVRSPEQFDHLRRYIADNPKAAGLGAGEYLYWRREDRDK